MNSKIELLKDLVPKQNQDINWNHIESSVLQPYIEKLKKTEQNPFYHAEGNVWTHTKMVVDSLNSLSSYQKLNQNQREILFLATLMHDFGKAFTTKLKDGQWVSPYHARQGSKIVREFMWRDLNISGNSELIKFRETVSTLIQYHSLPIYIFERDNPSLILANLAANQKLLPDFSIELLCILVEADMRGRKTSVKQEALESVELCRLLAQENNSFDHSIVFPDDYSEYSYLSGKNIMPGQQLYDNTWGEVIQLSGLPASGKDTYISRKYSDYPIISLDKIRKEKGILPSENQTEVILEANRLAKDYLRNHVPFVWNATNITPEIRRKQTSMFEQYGASTKIDYLETDFKTLLERNKNRNRTVPENVINNMLRKIVLPERNEASSINWITN